MILEKGGLEGTELRREPGAQKRTSPRPAGSLQQQLSAGLINRPSSVDCLRLFPLRVGTFGKATGIACHVFSSGNTSRACGPSQVNVRKQSLTRGGARVRGGVLAVAVRATGSSDNGCYRSPHDKGGEGGLGSGVGSQGTGGCGNEVRIAPVSSSSRTNKESIVSQRGTPSASRSTRACAPWRPCRADLNRVSSAGGRQVCAFSRVGTQSIDRAANCDSDKPGKADSGIGIPHDYFSYFDLKVAGALFGLPDFPRCNDDTFLQRVILRDLASSPNASAPKTRFLNRCFLGVEQHFSRVRLERCRRDGVQAEAESWRFLSPHPSRSTFSNNGFDDASAASRRRASRLAATLGGLLTIRRATG